MGQQRMRTHDEVAKDIARIALREDHRFDSDLLLEIMAYAWDQLLWRKTDAELVALRAGLSLEDDQ